MSPVTFRIDRTDAMDLDLDTADEMAAVSAASSRADRLPFPPRVGAATLLSVQLGSDCRPMEGAWLARDDRGVVGWAVAEFPWRDNTDTAHIRGTVHPDARRLGIGRALLAEILPVARAGGRDKIYTGAWDGTDGVEALRALGFSSAGLGINAVRRLDVHNTARSRWDRLYDEAAGKAGEYELLHQIGPTPAEQIPGLVTLHEAINDAPLDDPGMEDDVWDAERVADYDRAMAGRRQTVHRVMARHRQSGDWAGMSMLCVDEFKPSLAFQEDTSVVSAHRGHRLGLLMKADMLRWIGHERPEVAEIDTWNATTNHHMIAVNEQLGTHVVARHLTFRWAG